MKLLCYDIFNIQQKKELRVLIDMFDQILKRKKKVFKSLVFKQDKKVTLTQQRSVFLGLVVLAEPLSQGSVIIMF